MDFIGSKLSLYEWIYDTIGSFLNTESFDGINLLDGCCGTGIISVVGASKGFKITANDLLRFPKIVIPSLTNTNPNDPMVADLVTLLNHTKNTEKGIFFNNYSQSAGRLYLSNYNAMRVDTLRKLIFDLENKNLQNYLLTCLIEAMNSVLNTTGVQAAFLKELKPRAKKKLTLERLKSFKASYEVTVENKDIVELLKEPNKFDVVYIDPPYVSREYGQNYHLFETLVSRDDENITPKGITGMIDWSYAKSGFCNKKVAKSLVHDIVKFSKTKLLIFSYNSEGLLNKEDFFQVARMENFKIECLSKQIKRYKSDSKRHFKKDPLYEFLFVIEK